MQTIQIGLVSYDICNNSFNPNVPFNDLARYLRMVYSNEKRFKSRFSSELKSYCLAYGYPDNIPTIELLEYYFSNEEPFSYKDAFEIENTTFKNLVFSSIDINELIKNLGNERVNVEGKNVTHKRYKEDGSYEMVNYDVIYELHKVDCSSLITNKNDDVEPYAYAVKCWCTSTNKEHWLWVEEEYAKKGALEAIASTVRVYENMIPHIKEIKRQGDVFLFEMDEDITPSGKIVPLDAKTYFDLLVAQT